MSKCPNCNTILCDPGLYYTVDGKRATSIKAKIECPSCEKVFTIKEMMDHLHKTRKITKQ